MVHAGVSRYFGQLTTIIPEQTENLRNTITVDAEKFDKKMDKIIFPPIVTIMASIQVSEGIKYLMGNTDNLLTKKILVVDLLYNSFDIIELS